MPKLNKYSVIYLIVKITFNKIRRKQFKKKLATIESRILNFVISNKKINVHTSIVLL